MMQDSAKRNLNIWNQTIKKIYMSSEGVAGAVINEYLYELDDMFGKQPIVTPIIASSSRENHVTGKGNLYVE